MAIYRSFRERGRPPSAADLAAELGVDLLEVAGALRELDEEDVIVLQPGTYSLWLAHPFSGRRPSLSRSRAGEQRWDAICIWDALGSCLSWGRTEP